MARVRGMFRDALSSALLALLVTTSGHALAAPHRLEEEVAANPRAAARQAREQLEQARAKADKAMELRALHMLVLAANGGGDAVGEEGNLASGVSVARELKDHRLLSELLTETASRLIGRNQIADATRHLDEASAIATEHKLPDSLAHAHAVRATISIVQGKGADALGWLLRALDLYETGDRRLEMSSTLLLIAAVYRLPDTASSQDLQKAADSLKRALDVLELPRLRLPASLVHEQLGQTQYRLQNYKLAREHWESALAVAREFDARHIEAMLTLRLGVLAKVEGRYDEALPMLDRAAVTLATSSNPTLVFSLTLQRAEVLSLQKQQQRSLAELARAKAILDKLDSARHEVDYFTAAAGIHARFGDFEQAHRAQENLRAADQRLASVSRGKEVDELRVRFDVQRKESENAMLKAQRAEAEFKRWMLIVAFMASVLVLGSVALGLRQRAKLASARAALAHERTQTMLMHAGKMMALGRLATGVMHEMSHPVATLTLLGESVQALLQQQRAQEAADTMPKIQREAERLAHLIQRLRNFARADPQVVDLHDLRCVVADARQLFQASIDMSHVQYAEDVPELWVRADSERLSLVIVNLVTNAVDAMRNSTQRALLLAAYDDGHCVHMSLRDTGVGLADGVKCRLFEPFFTTKPPGEGLGLGLAMSADAVASMGGSLTGENDPHGGAVFTVTLPRADKPAGSSGDCFQH